MTSLADVVGQLTRPIIGIENRTAQEVFDIMADRIRSGLRAIDRSSPEAVREQAAKLCKDAADGAADLHNMAAKDHDRDGVMIHGEAWRIANQLAAAIRAMELPDPAREAVR